MSRPRLSDVQRRALYRLSPRDWRGNIEADVGGSTLEALERKGLARTAVVKRPHRRHVARLTDAGVRLARELDLDALERRWRAGVETGRVGQTGVRLWIAGRITRAELDAELDAAAAIANRQDREAALERLALDTLEQLGRDGATVHELADLLAGRDLVVEDLAELERALDRLGDRVRRVAFGQAEHNRRVFAAIYPTPTA